MESKDPDVIRECVIILHYLFKFDENIGRTFISNSLSKDIKKNMGKKLIQTIKEDPYNYISYLSELLTYLAPEKAIRAILDIFKSNNSDRMILNGWTYPELIKSAYDKLHGNKEWVIDECNQLIENLNDEKKKEELRIILRKL